MSIKFGRIDYSDTHFVEQDFHKNQVVTSASEGVHHHFMKKDDYSDIDTGGFGTLSVLGSHWAFVHTMFYMSGSSKVNPDERDKFNGIYDKFNQHNDLKPFYNTKFYDSGSVFYIPQQLFGERIKPGTFQLTARTGSSSNITKEIKIVDDNNGNLYSTNAEYSQSVGHLSSSENYVGNIFYDLGIATLTETASWSGSVNYPDIGREAYPYWDIKFNSTTPIFTHQYSIRIPAGQFNRTINYSARGESTGSNFTGLGNLRNELTASGWLPYFNQIQLYRNQAEDPVIIANLPRSIQMRDDLELIITFRLDN